MAQTRYQIDENPFSSGYQVAPMQGILPLIQELREPFDEAGNDPQLRSSGALQNHRKFDSEYNGEYSLPRVHWEKPLGNKFRPIVRVSTEIQDIAESQNEKLLDRLINPFTDNGSESSSFDSVSIYSTLETTPEIPPKSPRRAHQASRDSGVSMSLSTSDLFIRASALEEKLQRMRIQAQEEHAHRQNEIAQNHSNLARYEVERARAISEANVAMTWKVKMFRLEAFAAELAYLPSSLTVEALRAAAHSKIRWRALRLVQRPCSNTIQAGRTASLPQATEAEAHAQVRKTSIGNEKTRSRSSAEILLEYEDANAVGRVRILQSTTQHVVAALLMQYESADLPTKQKILEEQLSSIMKHGTGEDYTFPDKESQMRRGDGMERLNMESVGKKGKPHIINPLHYLEDPLADLTKKESIMSNLHWIEDTPSEEDRFLDSIASEPSPDSLLPHEVTDHLEFPLLATENGERNADRSEVLAKRKEVTKLKRGRGTLRKKKKQSCVPDLPLNDYEKKELEYPFESKDLSKKKPGILRRTLSKLGRPFKAPLDNCDDKTKNGMGSLDWKGQSVESFAIMAMWI